MKMFKMLMFYVAMFLELLSFVSTVLVTFTGEPANPTIIHYCIIALAAIIPVIFFFKDDRHDLNMTTRQFYRDNKVIHNTIYLTILIIGAMIPVFAGLENYTYILALLFFSGFVSYVALGAGLWARYNYKEYYGLVLAVSWLTGAITVSVSPLTSYFKEPTSSICGAIIVLLYVVSYYVGVRKQ